MSSKGLKLIDFGWSSLFDDTRMTFCGTTEYLSPEMILGQSQNTKIDMWAIGIIMYELLHGKSPFLVSR